MTAIHIRPIQESDLEAYKALRLEALRLYPEAFSSDYQAQKEMPESFWQNRIHSAIESADQVLYGAEREGQLIGSAGCVREDSPKARHNGLIVGVYVQDAYRGQALAQKLIQACLDWALDHEITIAKLGVGAHNQAAIRCYQTMGFEHWGTEPRALLVNGHYIDEWQMAKVLV